MDQKTIKTKYKLNIVKAVVLAISISIMTLAVGTSYAILNGSTTSDNEQVIKAGNIKLLLTEHFNNLDGGIRVMKDSEGLISNVTYSFTVKNIGTGSAEYVLKLLNDVPNDYEGDVLSTDYIKVGLQVNGKEFGPMGLEDVNNIIDKNSLAPNEVNSYKLRIWLDKEQEEDLEDMEDYNAFLKLKVEAKQNTTVKSIDKSIVYTSLSGTNRPYYLMPGVGIQQDTYSGYCLIAEEEGDITWNSCTDKDDEVENFGFNSVASCEEYLNKLIIYNGSVVDDYSCEAGSWTNDVLNYVLDYNDLDYPYFLRHHVNQNYQITSIDACLVSDQHLYCFNPGTITYDSTNDVWVSSAFQDNVDILDEIFDSSDCDSSRLPDEYSCYNNSLAVHVRSNGQLQVGTLINNEIFLGCGFNTLGEAICTSSSGGPDSSPSS